MWVKPGGCVVAVIGRVGVEGLFCSAAISALSALLSSWSPFRASSYFASRCTASSRVKWFRAHDSLHVFMPSTSAWRMHSSPLKLYRVSWKLRHCSVSWVVRLLTVCAHAFSMAVMRWPIAFTAREACLLRAAPF